MTSPELAKSALLRLQTAYDAYLCAELGQLNPTADTLNLVAKELGWPGRGVEPILPWVRKKLGV